MASLQGRVSDRRGYDNDDDHVKRRGTCTLDPAVELPREAILLN